MATPASSWHAQKPGRRLVARLAATAAATAVASSLLSSSPALAEVRPTLTVLSPAPQQLVTENVIRIDLQTQSRFAIREIAIRLPEHNWTSIDSECDLGLQRCQVLMDLDEWEYTLLETFPDGPFSFQLKASDENYVNGPPVTVTVILSRNQSGAILYSPVDGDVVSGLVTMRAISTGNAESVAFYVNGVQLAGEVTYMGDFWHITWDTTQLPDGLYSIAVGGYDGNFDPPGEAIAVRVDNPTPTLLRLDEPKGRSQGQITHVSGVLVVLDGRSPLASQPIKLAIRTLRGQPHVLQTTTTATGAFTFALSSRGVPIPAVIEASFSGNSEFAASQDSLSFRKDQRITYTSSNSEPRIGEAFTLRVTVSPARVTEIALFYLNRSGRWTAWKVGKTNRNGVWTKSFSGRQQGTFRSMAYAEVTDFYTDARSDTLVLRFR